MLCKFGCGSFATSQLKNGSWICGTNVASCPINKHKVSLKAKGAHWTGTSKARPVVTSELCSYGCNTIAKFRFRNGKKCCSSTIKKCVGYTHRLSSTIKRVSESTLPEIRSRRILQGWSKRSRRTRKTALTSEQVRSRLSDLASRRDNHHGRGIKGYYKGIWCDSSWELAWVLFALDHEIPFVRNTEVFSYTHKGRCKKYKPDFKVFGYWVEIKGRANNRWKSKQRDFPDPNKLVVLYGDDLKVIFEYVRSRYGKDYILLYDNSTLSKNCKFCGKEFYDSRNGNQKFCSLVCHTASRRGMGRLATISITGTKLCSYGCESIAKYQYASTKRFCCSQDYHQCTGYRTLKQLQAYKQYNLIENM